MKFRRLQRRLGVGKSTIVGTLELLWITTQKNAPRGDIGRFDNEAIAIECNWDGDPDELIDALVETGWLDRNDHYRLVVHDWHEHAPYYIHGVVSKIGGFVNKLIENLNKLSPVENYSPPLQSATTVTDCSEDQRNLTKPNLTKPNEIKHSLSANADEVDLASEPNESPSESHCEIEAEFSETWNRVDGNVKVVRWTAQRRKQFRTRIREPAFRDNWQTALMKFPLKCFSQADGWRPDLDWFLRPDTVMKILEGKYDWTKDDGKSKLNRGVGDGQRYRGD